MNVLFIGQKFHGLDRAISASALAADFCSEDEFLKIDNTVIERYTVIVVLRLNIMLNNAKLNIFHSVFQKSAPSATLIFWTHETFWDRTLESNRMLFGRNTIFMNCYTGDVFVSPFSFYFGVGGYLWSPKRITKVDLPSKEFLQSRFISSKNATPVCAFNTCFHGNYHDVGDSLLRLRNDFTKYMYDQNLCTVYGRNWYGKWALDVASESRAGTDAQSWGNIKVEDSRSKYSFSICVENTLLPNYVTEKLGHAIESWLLPIYCFENNVNTVMDVSGALHINSNAETKEFEELRDLVTNMEFGEYMDRLGSIVDSYNKVIEQVAFVNEERLRPAEKLIENILGCGK